MPAAAFDSDTMDMKVIYNKGGKRNGYHGNDFDRPSDWDNDYSDEDEVFVEGPNMDRTSATKPLMYPRSRGKSKLSHGSFRRCRHICKAICCFLFLVLTLGSMMGMVVYFVNKHENEQKTSNKVVEAKPGVLKFVGDKKLPDFSGLVGCDHIEVEDVWTVGIPKLLTESAFRLVDVNQDGVIDVILGFGTGADGYYIPKIVCDIYFDSVYPCFGGLLALEGATGRELWRHYAEHELFGINCGADLNKDGVNDCLAGGRAGAFRAVSGKDGTLIWNFESQEAKNDIMNLYTAQIIADIDGDGTVDVLAIHGGDPLQDPGSAYRLSGRILLMSGSTGHVIRWVGVPDGKESYYSPQLLVWPDGSEFVLFGTGGETHGGSLWVVRLSDLIRGKIKEAFAIFTDTFKGVMTPPVLADVTEDGVEDIIIPVFNASILAYDGQTFKLIWNYTLPQSESYSTPSPGYYNDDDVPDFLVKSAHGPGFPVYYHSETTVLDGRTGRPLINPSMRDTVGAQASGLTVSMEGRGNDLFLYWMADCLQHEGEGGQFQFVEGTNVHEQSRSDFCRLRFKTKGYSKLLAINQHIPQPGTALYYSGERTELEHSKWLNTTQQGMEYVRDHPEYIAEYQRFALIEAGQATNDDEDSNADLPEEEGSESLFETPVMDDSERTTYKKGPSGPYRHSEYEPKKDYGLSDYEYNSPYYEDPYNQYQGRTYTNSRRKGGLLNNSGYNRNNLNNRRPDEYFATTKPPIYNRYRTKYPAKDRRANGRPFNFETNVISSKNKVDPIFMRSKRGTRKHNTDHKSSKRKRRGIKSFESNTRNVEKLNSHRKRRRRHVGPHDEEGLQRLLSTGSLIPTLLPKDNPNFNHSIDVLFATYWFFPAKTRAILPEDQKCIERKLSEETIRFDPKSQYFGMDHDAYEHAVTDECVSSSNHDMPDTGVYESQETYNPFNVHMGQMTVYRVRLTCSCSNITASSSATSGSRCARILPFDQQQWYAYMGNNADSHWLPRKDYL